MIRPTYTNGGQSQYAVNHGLPLESPDLNQTEDQTMNPLEVAELPQWKAEPPPSPPPEPDRRPQILELTDTTEVRIEHGSFGRLRIWLGHKLLTSELSEAEERSRTLRGLLAETERALPILRAMVENLEKS